MNSHLVLTDQDVRRLVDYKVAVEKMEDALREHAQGNLVAPPRSSLDTKLGSLVFTAGAVVGNDPALGFRVYDTFSGSATDSDQIVAVFDPVGGGLSGIIIGSLVGAMRTGALGGVAIKHLARPESKKLAVIGAGLQARSQLQAALAVSGVDQVVISSRTASSAEQFRNEVLQHHQLECTTAATTKDAVQDADVVILATSSSTPVLESDWIKPGAHVTTVGPKSRGAQELPSDFGERSAVVVTDSTIQLKSYGDFFLDTGPAPFGLDQIVAGKRDGRTDPNQITLYCSVGLAGTEVVLANEILKRAAASQAVSTKDDQGAISVVW